MTAAELTSRIRDTLVAANTAVSPQPQPGLAAPGFRVPTHPSAGLVADLQKLEHGASRRLLAGPAFGDGWSRLGKRLEDHGLAAPSQPWLTYDDSKMQQAIKSAPSQAGFRPVAKSTVAAANELPFVMAQGTDSALKNAFAKVIRAVHDQSWAAPADVQQLASSLAKAATGPLDRQKEIALELKAAIDRFAGEQAPVKKGGWL